MNVFEALKNSAVTTTTANVMSSSSALAKDATVTGSAKSGSAARNAVWL